ncbi:hypothetical protein [Sphingobium chungbukense]|uniref:Uncharacterized protein n=1 Tax=Sphingobium chungbukense TaxID=56193 RepID=A0A0M3ASC8_9SPHN|nr:hypothetical protein [Sphingobium chungbukense]KKW93117.1 hypothetical protein YP76_05790 [Sphingobium chungbukense]
MTFSPRLTFGHNAVVVKSTPYLDDSDERKSETRWPQMGKPRKARRLAGLIMVGVARIELAIPAMSRQRGVVIFLFENSSLENRLGAASQNLPSSSKVEFPSNLAASCMTVLNPQIVDVRIFFYLGR